MELKPLEQWYCDYCGGVINSARDGWLEWLVDDETHLAHGFKIVHHLPASPNNDRRKEKGCYHYEHVGEQTAHLEEFTGSDGLSMLLTFFDHGYVHPGGGPWVRDIQELVELMRRLQTPHYEEARRYWSDAEEDGSFDGANEMSPYAQGALKRIIREYSDTARARS